MSDVSMKYQYGSNVWEERFVNVSLPASDYTTIAFYTGIRYTFGIVCNVGVTLSGVTVEEYLNDGYRTTRAPSLMTTTVSGVTYNIYTPGVADTNPIPLIEGCELDLQTTEYALNSYALNQAISDYFNPVSPAGQGVVTLNVPANGKTLTFTSQATGEVKSVLVSGNMTVDIRPS